MPHALSPSTTRREKSSLNKSRTTLISMFGSSYMVTGLAPLRFFASAVRLSMSCHRPSSRFTSAAMASLDTPSAAVRMIVPEPDGVTSLRISFRRLRSGSGSLREMPALWPPGT